jgi:hypothetical protein
MIAPDHTTKPHENILHERGHPYMGDVLRVVPSCRFLRGCGEECPEEIAYGRRRLGARHGRPSNVKPADCKFTERMLHELVFGAVRAFENKSVRMSAVDRRTAAPSRREGSGASHFKVRIAGRT